MWASLSCLFTCIWKTGTITDPSCLCFGLFILNTLLCFLHYHVSLRSPCKHSWILHAPFERRRTSPGQRRGAARAPFGAKREDAARRCQRPGEVPGSRRASAGREAPCSCPGHGKAPVGVCDAGSRFQKLSCFVQYSVNILQGCLKFPVFVWLRQGKEH